MATQDGFLAPSELWAVSFPSKNAGQVIGSRGSTIKQITEQSGAHVAVKDAADGSKFAELNGSAQSCIHAAVGVLSKLHHVEGPVQVQASIAPTEEQAAIKLAQCRELAKNSPVLGGAVTATVAQAADAGPAGHYSALLLQGEFQAVLAALHRTAELVWGVQDAFGIAVLCAEIPAARVSGLIGQGGANAKHLRGLGVEFDVPRSRPQIGNCTIQFSMPAASREAATAAVQQFVGAETVITWSAPALPVGAAGGGAAAGGGSDEVDAASATEALQGAFRSAVSELLTQMQSPERPAPVQIGDTLRKHQDGITAEALGRLQRGIFACYQAAFGVGLGHAAHGQDSGAADGALAWMQECMQALHSEAAAAMQSPLAASSLQGPSGSTVDLNKNTECLFFPSPTAHSRLLQILRRANTSLDVAVFSITDNDIADTLVTAMQRGVAVRVISDDEQVKQQGSDILRLQAAGVPVKVDPSPQFHMHHKFVVIDGLLVATGSYNWTQQAHTGNQENLLVVEDTHAVKEYQACFENMWKSFRAPKA